MRRLLTIVVAVVAIATTWLLCLNLWNENQRLRNNQHSMNEGITFYKTKADDYAASVEALTLEVDEFRQQHEADSKQIRDLGIRLRRLESYAKSITQTTLQDTIILRDTIICRDTILYGINTTPWNTISTTILNDRLTFKLENIDTLHQIVYRVPRKFWFIRFGTKAIRQEIWSSNPNTELIYTEYIELPRRNKRR